MYWFKSNKEYQMRDKYNRKITQSKKSYNRKIKHKKDF